jgi:hypothetical protein
VLLLGYLLGRHTQSHKPDHRHLGVVGVFGVILVLGAIATQPLLLIPTFLIFILLAYGAHKQNEQKAALKAQEPTAFKLENVEITVTPQGAKKSKNCERCGAPASDGHFCRYCGGPLG